MYCKKMVANLFYLNCKLSPGTNLCSDNKNNIILDTANGQIVMDWRINTIEDCMAGVHLICSRLVRRIMQQNRCLRFKNSEDINHYILSLCIRRNEKSTGKAVGLKLTDLFNNSENLPWESLKRLV